MKLTIAYSLIQDLYGKTCAKRSGVPLMNHINEGLIILDAIGADRNTQKAYCMHPILQDDANLAKYFNIIAKHISPTVIMYAMEYRNIANSYLSAKVDSGEVIKLSPIRQVNQMLIADKVQNRKDFELYHKGKHEKSDELDRYFKQWLNRLEISEEKYRELVDLL